NAHLGCSLTDIVSCQAHKESGRRLVLNPPLVEALMGFPDRSTDSAAWEMPLFRSRRPQRCGPSWRALWHDRRARPPIRAEGHRLDSKNLRALGTLVLAVSQGSQGVDGWLAEYEGKIGGAPTCIARRARHP